MKPVNLCDIRTNFNFESSFFILYGYSSIPGSSDKELCNWNPYVMIRKRISHFTFIKWILKIHWNKFKVIKPLNISPIWKIFKKIMMAPLNGICMPIYPSIYLCVCVCLSNTATFLKMGAFNLYLFVPKQIKWLNSKQTPLAKILLCLSAD